MRTFTPASFALFLAAIGMMVNAHWPWGQNWIVFGLIAWGLSATLGNLDDARRVLLGLDAKGKPRPGVMVKGDTPKEIVIGGRHMAIYHMDAESVGGS